MIVTNSRFTASNFRRIFGIEPTVCHLGIPLPPEMDYHRGEYVGVLTTFLPMKNMDNVIRAMDILVNGRGRRDIRMRVAGTGRDGERLAAMVQRLGLSENIRFTGPIPDAALPGFYNRARLVVYCPIDEPFGLVPLEAMAAKTPVVVSDHGGPAEIVEHEKCGLQVNPFDPVAIADAVERLWSEEGLAREMGIEADRRVREGFSLDAFLDRFEEAAKYCLSRDPLRP